MNRLISILVLAVFTVIAFGCKKKSPATVNTAYCTTCTATPLVHTVDTDSVFYFLPTAFTPNGDGINDIFFLLYNNLVVDSSSISIWDINGREVFSKNIGASARTSGWDGTDMSGKKCGAGEYPVHVKLLTNKGTVVNVCACVNLLQYSGSCLNTKGITYYFPDQVNIDSGYVNQTNEQICP